jgi:D-alanyl-lipoteichoic acid acyltransferase DltB (MBOAT superfamily)
VLFPTLTFAVFFSIVLPLSWLLASRNTLWKWMLLVASWIFYGWWDVGCLMVLIASGVVNHALGDQIAAANDRATARRWLTGSIVLNLLVLVYYKYLDFLADSILRLTGWSQPVEWVANLDIALPVGVSFFTFHAISYVVDLYRGSMKPVSRLDFSLYMAFFPHLVAGPIVRASELAPQLAKPPDPKEIDLGRALTLIGGGLFKKVVIADAISTQLVDPVYAAPWDYPGSTVALALYAYSFQVFADFSAYTDIAIGLANLMGIRFPQNFDNPYVSRSIQEFWRRWHMTLGRFLRDYVYIPLGGARHGTYVMMRALFLTMVVGGIWHGASWLFVIWGCAYGSALIIERLFYEVVLERPVGSGGPVAAVFQRIFTFNFITLMYLPFRAASVDEASAVLRAIFTQPWVWPDVSPRPVLAAAFGLAMVYFPVAWQRGVEEGFRRLPVLAQAAVVGAVLAVVDALGTRGVAAFIYFQF